jgi:hypothetical protein
MLLFHGTNEDALEGILKRGLEPPRPEDNAHDWMWQFAGRSQSSLVFLSTAPVAGKGGDPVSFASGWPARRFKPPRPGYIIVVDLPPDAMGLVHAVIPNAEFDNFTNVSTIRQMLHETSLVESGQEDESGWRPFASWYLSNWCLHYWLVRYCLDHRIPFAANAIDTILKLRVMYRDPVLPEDLTPAHWQAFLEDYFRFVGFAYWGISSEQERERRRKAIVSKYGLTLPEDIEEDSHSKFCELCIAGRFWWTYEFAGFATYAPFQSFLRSLPVKGGHKWPPSPVLKPYILPLTKSHGATLPQQQQIAVTLRAVAAHTQHIPAESLLRFFRQRDASRQVAWNWNEWYETFPLDESALPHSWHPKYCQQFSDSDLKLPDRQILADAIPLRYIIGAIKITDGEHFLPHIRPSRRKGETLAAKLWTITHAMRSEYSGKLILR